MFLWNPKALTMVLIGLVALTLPGSLGAHSDPWGEIHPGLEVHGGKFILNFTRQEPDESNMAGARLDMFRIVFNPDGTVDVPRHVISPESFHRPEVGAGGDTDPRGVRLTGSNEALKGRQMVLTEGSRLEWRETPLPVNGDRLVYLKASTFATAGIGIVANEHPPGDISYYCNLVFLHVDPQGFKEAKRVTLGTCPTVYDFPAASAPVWAASRWWIAWVRMHTPRGMKAAKDEDIAPELTLSSYDPVSGEVKHKPLNDHVDGDTTISLKTVGGWLGVAWSSSNLLSDGRRQAKIVTAFEKLPAP